MTKLCFGDGDVFVHLTLLNIYNELGPLVLVENVSKNLQIL